MRVLLCLVLCSIGCSVAYAHEKCDVSYVLNEKSAGEIAGPVHLEYPFQVGDDWYRLTVDNQSFTSTGNFFLLHKEGKVYTANEPYNSQIQVYDLGGSVLQTIPVPRTSVGGPQSINSLFITASGAFICKEAGGEYPGAEGNKLWRRSPDGVWTTDETKCSYLGVTSIDEVSGVIMIAEYRADTVLTNKVVRSKDDGRTWETVFSQRALGSPDPQIRHFHTLAVDPWRGEWHLSSGDGPQHSRAWKSSDQGDTWVEITDPDNDPTAPLLAQRTQLLHRQTAPVFTSEFMAWALDDRLAGTGAVWVISPRTTPLELKVVGRTSFNAPRSAVHYPGLGWLLLTENMTEYRGIELVLVTEGTFGIIPLGVIEGVHSYFSSSSASITAEGNLLEGGQTAFSLSRGFETMTLRYTIVREYALEVESVDLSCGHVELEPPSTSGYARGSRVTVKAVPELGCTFHGFVVDNWLTRQGVVEVEMKDDVHLTASFSAVGSSPEVQIPVMGSMGLCITCIALLLVGGTTKR